MKRQMAIGTALLAVIFTLVSCGGGSGDSDKGGGGLGEEPGVAVFTGTAGGATYRLEITEAARYAAQAGDTFALTTAGKTSSGTVVSFNGTMLTLRSEGASADFAVAVTGSDIVSIVGTVNWTYPDGSKVIDVVSLTFDTSDDDDDDYAEGEAEYWQQWMDVQTAQGYTEGWPSAALQSEYSVNFNNEGEFKLYLHAPAREELEFLKVGSTSAFDDLMSQISTSTWEQIANNSGEGFRYIIYHSTDEEADESGSIEATYTQSPYSQGIIQIKVKRIIYYELGG